VCEVDVDAGISGDGMTMKKARNKEWYLRMDGNMDSTILECVVYLKETEWFSSPRHPKIPSFFLTT